jgi:hypothetical protein
MLLDYLVEDDGLLITTRTKVLTSKETRVYSVKLLQDLSPDEIALVIRQSVRPWSWRSLINDLGDQLKSTPLPAEAITSMVKSSVQVAGAEISEIAPVQTSEEGTPVKSKSDIAAENRQMELLGNALANGMTTLAQASLSAMEIMHYADPPTGTIQTLGNKLVITQSQAAHREIAELLRQLAEE